LKRLAKTLMTAPGAVEPGLPVVIDRCGRQSGLAHAGLREKGAWGGRFHGF